MPKTIRHNDADRLVVVAKAVVSLCGWFSHADSKRFIDEHIRPRINL